MSKPRTDSQRAASARNGKHSRGPVSDAGKARSSRNALKHGLTGAGLVITHEDQGAFDETFNALDDDLKPVGALESILVKRIALTSTRLDRLARQECAVLSLKAREATGQYDRTVQDHVEQLGKRLLNDPVPRAGSPLPNRYLPEVLKWKDDEPIVLVMELKQTVAGCDYLLERWRELQFILANEGYWHYDSKFRAIRMLGKRFETFLDDVLVGDLFACCHALHPELQDKWLLSCQHAVWCADNRPTYHLRIAKLGERIPAETRTALEFLHGIVEGEIAALEAVREQLMPVCEANRSEAPLRSAIDDTKQGELRRRYETANERELHKCVDDFLKVRKMRGQEAVQADEARRNDHASGPRDTPENVACQKLESDSGTPSRSLRNEPEHHDTEAPIQPSEHPNRPDTGSGWGKFAP